MSQSERYESDEDTSTSAEPVSTTVVDAVAAAAGREPHELEPLYHVLDPDALDHIFEDSGTQNTHRVGRVEFTYCGFEVVVSAGRSGASVSVY